MRHVGQGAELLLETEDRRGIGALEGLEGDRHATLFVERAVDDAHAATPQLVLDAIATEPLQSVGRDG